MLCNAKNITVCITPPIKKHQHTMFTQSKLYKTPRAHIRNTVVHTTHQRRPLQRSQSNKCVVRQWI